jgi:hypothetical protein
VLDVDTADRLSTALVDMAGVSVDLGVPINGYQADALFRSDAGPEQPCLVDPGAVAGVDPVTHLSRMLWAASFFPDSCLIAILCCELPVQVLVVDLLWGLVSECRVETLSIVAEFDVPGNVCSGVFAGGVDGAVDPFDFHGGVEGLG